jgi:cyanophycinase
MKRKTPGMLIKNFGDWLVESFNLKYEDMIAPYLRNGQTFALVGGSESEKCLELVINGLGSANLLVVTAATAHKEDAERKYLPIFNRLGCITTFLHTSTVSEVDTEENLKKLDVADTIFFVGGDQSRITECYLGTYFLSRMKQRVSEGMAVVGTSAGAMALSGEMIAGGKSIPLMKKGLSMLPDIVVDTHFRERGRISRLEIAVGLTSGKIGLGISEDTAIIFRGREVFVFGQEGIEVIS